MTDLQGEQRAMPPHQQPPVLPSAPPASYGPPASAHPGWHGVPAPSHHSPFVPPSHGTQRPAVASLSLGIAGLAASAIPGVNVVTAVGAVVGIVLGASVVRGDRAGLKKAVWGIALSSAALLSTAVTWALILLALWSFSTTQNSAVASTMMSDASTYSVAAEAHYATTMEYPASADIPAGTVPPEFPGVTASENTISFVNNGESFTITITNPDAVPDETVVYDSLSGFVTP